MTMQFAGKKFTFTQPDGSSLDVRGWGNQYHAVFETLNDMTVIEDPLTEAYYYAKVNEDSDDLVSTGVIPRQGYSGKLGIPNSVRAARSVGKAKANEHFGLRTGTSRWEQRRKEYRGALRALIAGSGIAAAPPVRSTVGDYLGLCLLIDFPDVKGTISRDEVHDFCNKKGYKGFGNNGSVYDYFFEMSGGRLRYNNIVAPYYTAKNPRGYYTNEKVAQPIRARELIKEALNYHKAQGFDFSGLTVDHKDYVFATNVFYAGTCVNNWAKGLWPHSYHLQTPYIASNGRALYDYQITDMTDELTLGTFCHENGHMICDFPDLYDYGYESSGVGMFCLMCAGGNADEKNPAQICAYLKFKAGWADEVVKINGSVQGALTAGNNRFYIHRKSATEYYLIEIRNRAGRDQALPSAGLAIWHIDELGDNSNEQMTADRHYECSLVQADGKFDLENDPHNYGDYTDLFSKSVNDHFGQTTTPNSSWWDGSSSGLDIKNISNGGTQMEFSAHA